MTDPSTRPATPMSGGLAYGTAPPVPSSRPPAHTISLVMALLNAGAGLVIAASPFGPWMSSRLVFFPADATGFTWFEEAEASWVLGPIPDGVPMTLIGLGLLAAAGLAAFLSWNRPGTPAPARLLVVLHGLIAVLGAAALVWTVLSYSSFADTYGSQIGAGTGMVLGALAALGAGAASAAAGVLLLTMKASPAATDA